jgi:SAM-dependent methyltransferase
MKQPWKDRLYAAYVSSGRSAILYEDPSKYFLPRKPYIQRVIHNCLPPSKSIQILDLGCGYGAFIYFLQQAGYWNIQGIDCSSEQVELAKRLGITGIDQMEISSYLMSVKNETFDVVLLMDVLEHFTRQELFDILDDVLRILRPGGKCIGHVPNAAGLFGMQVRYGDLSHEMAFTPGSINQVFSIVGFDQIQCFEEKPVIHGIVSAIRWLLWNIGSFPSRVMLAAETGGTDFVLSQNILFTSTKPKSMPDFPRE